MGSPALRRLERLLRMIDPHRRLAKLKPLGNLPKRENALTQVCIETTRTSVRVRA